jgi:hypothetical protein
MNGDEFHYLFLCQNEVIQMEEKKVYSTVFCSKFKTECCRYATKNYVQYIILNIIWKYNEENINDIIIVSQYLSEKLIVIQ